MQKKIAFCPIQKVASSEWGKFFNRLEGDPDYARESWQHRNFTRVRKWFSRPSNTKTILDPTTKDREGLRNFNDIAQDPDWTFAVFLRDPILRLQSFYLMLYFSKMEGKRHYLENFRHLIPDHRMTFAEFIDLVTDPDDPVENIHWSPQSRFCNIKEHIHLYNFVGNFEKMSEQAPLLLKCTKTWTDYGSNGWGASKNTSIFARAESVSAPHATQQIADRDSLAPITPEIRSKVRRFFHEDYELNDRIRSIPYDPMVWGST